MLTIESSKSPATPRDTLQIPLQFRSRILLCCATRSVCYVRSQSNACTATPGVRHVEFACRSAPRSRVRCSRSPDLPDDVLCFRRYRSSRRIVQSGTARPRIQSDIEPHRRGARRAPCRSGRRSRRGLHGEWNGGDAHRHRHAAGRRRPYRCFGLSVRRYRESAGAHPPALRHNHLVRAAARRRWLPRGPPAEYASTARSRRPSFAARWNWGPISSCTRSPNGSAAMGLRSGAL